MKNVHLTPKGSPNRRHYSTGALRYPSFASYHCRPRRLGHLRWVSESRQVGDQKQTYDVGPSFEQFAALALSSPRPECLGASGFCPEHHTAPTPPGGGDPEIPSFISRCRGSSHLARRTLIPAACFFRCFRSRARWKVSPFWMPNSSLVHGEPLPREADLALTNRRKSSIPSSD